MVLSARSESNSGHSQGGQGIAKDLNGMKVADKQIAPEAEPARHSLCQHDKCGPWQSRDETPGVLPKGQTRLYS